METQKHDNHFEDTSDTIYLLMADEVLIECPRCGRCATHSPIAKRADKCDWFAPRRLICTHCALTRDWHDKVIHRCWHESPPRDDYFNEVLWIRGAFRSNEIWAYNWQHLELIEKYVAATQRQHARDTEFGWVNKSFINRLPKWLSSAKNRDDVLKRIARIKLERKTGR